MLEWGRRLCVDSSSTRWAEGHMHDVTYMHSLHGMSTVHACTAQWPLQLYNKQVAPVIATFRALTPIIALPRVVNVWHDLACDNEPPGLSCGASSRLQSPKLAQTVSASWGSSHAPRMASAAHYTTMWPLSQGSSVARCPGTGLTHLGSGTGGCRPLLGLGHLRLCQAREESQAPWPHQRSPYTATKVRRRHSHEHEL